MSIKQHNKLIKIRRRLYIVVTILVLGSTALIVRAVDLQIVRKEFYQEQGDARFLREVPIPVSRGMINDRNGEPLAVSTPVESIWVNPSELLKYTEQLPSLANVLQLDETALREKLERYGDKEFMYLKRHLNPDDAQAILKLKIPGVASQREFRRYYPTGEVMGHVLGFTNIDDHGQEGLELAFDDWLSGKSGIKRVIRDRLGHIVENVELVRESKPGHDLVLTLDSRIQYLAYRELKTAILENRATSGSMVIVDIANGEILAMVNQPSFNPNARTGSEAAARRNRTVTDVIEPGSTMKPFTIAAALEDGRWTSETLVDTTPGTMAVAGHIVRDVHNVGLISVTKVLTKSSNVGAAKIALSLSNEHLYDVFRRFGFGESTGCGFPGEAPGMLPAPRTWGILGKATLAYGYGLNVTPLQLAQAYAALANEGRLRLPTFVKGEVTPESAVMDPQIAETIIRMLETVVSAEGTGLKAAVPNYRVAGKTGTSRRAVSGGYESRYISLFAGVVPVTEPRLVGVVVIHDPGGGSGGAYYGGLVAAPVFSRVMTSALRLLDVIPDNIQGIYTNTNTNTNTNNLDLDQSAYEEGVPP